MKYSKQRNTILNTVVGNPIHPTAEQVYEAVRAENPTISLGTVYRNLNQLAENRLLRKIPISDGSDRFDGRLDEHYHAVCTACGRVVDVEIAALDGIIQQTKERSGFRVTEYDLTLKGVCGDCRLAY